MAILKKMVLPVLTGMAYIFLYLPILILIVFSFNKTEGVFRWTGFSLHWYRELFYSSEIICALKNSLIIAFSSVFLSLLLGVLVVIFGLRYRVFKLFFLFFSSTLAPEIVVALGLLGFFSFFRIPLGLITLIAGHTLIGLSYIVPVVYSRYLELDKKFLEASLDLGASTKQTFFKIILPLLLPALFSSALLVFVLSLEDLLIAFFCSGGDAQTLSLYIFAAIRSEVSPVINALSTLMMLATILIVLLIGLLNKRLRWY